MNLTVMNIYMAKQLNKIYTTRFEDKFDYRPYKK